MSDYEKWIEQNVSKTSNSWAVVRKMVKAFPELKPSKGTVEIVGPYGSKHSVPHHWCAGPEGLIDPTVSRFAQVIRYTPMDNVRKCMNCGKMFDGTALFCSRECTDSYMRCCNG